MKTRANGYKRGQEKRCLIRVSAAGTNGAYSLIEIVSESRDGTPIHIHQNEDEHFIVLEGTARVMSGDKTFDAAAGTAVTLRKGVPGAIYPILRSAFWGLLCPEAAKKHSD
jgi:mannose-6-phosphate isomerase-like protein (cupin superfamily)